MFPGNKRFYCWDSNIVNSYDQYYLNGPCPTTARLSVHVKRFMLKHSEKNKPLYDLQKKDSINKIIETNQQQ